MKSWNKQRSIMLILVLWAVFSLGYIGYDRWDRFKNTELMQAYKSGSDDTQKQIISALLEQATRSDCLGFSVTLDKQQVQLVKADCVTGNKNMNGK
jgi:hypothetical protein